MKTIQFKNSIRRNLRRTGMLALTALLFVACSDDDDGSGDNPEPVEEEETITNMLLTLVPQGDGNTITLESVDLDGDGPDTPQIMIGGGNFLADTEYSGSIKLSNNTVSPAEDITEEIEEEDEEHQFFFAPTGSLTAVSYEDMDGDGNPIGLSFLLNTGEAGEGTLTVTLRHLPKKPNDGTLADAGGETDIAQTFEVVVE